MNLRGHDDLGGSFLTVLERYEADLQEHQSKLMLAGVSGSVVEQLEKTGLIKIIGREKWVAGQDRESPKMNQFTLKRFYLISFLNTLGDLPT